MSTTLSNGLTWSGELRMPAPPVTRRARERTRHATAGRTPAWREAMAGALVGLLGSWALGEALLLLNGF
jgi:hypothetical protein